MAMQVDPRIRASLVHLLYSAMPQVASSTMGTALLATTIWWRIPSAAAFGLIVAALVLVIIRLSILLAYKWRNGDAAAAPAEAVFWERLYGAFSILMAMVIAAVLLNAFVYGDSGSQLLSAGVAIGICGGQSTARVTCRPWIPLTSGAIILSSLTLCAFLWDDPLSMVFAFFAVLYLYTYTEACRHSARTILGRLVAESEVAKLARRDALTGLANRRGFEEELERAFLAHRRSKSSLSLLMLDLDGFKAVNDELGHPAGDAVLREIAARLARLSRRTDFIARLGGDEFAILVSDRHDQESVVNYARRLIVGISEKFILSGETVEIGVSIGVGTATALGPEGTAELLAATDAALYKVKKGAKNDIAVATWKEAPAASESLAGVADRARAA